MLGLAVQMTCNQKHPTCNGRSRSIQRGGTSDKGRCMLHAYVPLAELFGYMRELPNFTSGTASFTMEPSHYAPVREELADLKAAS